MKTNELRRKYLEFFQSKGHTLCPSDVMVPKWDKTVLFTPAGMNQFKDHFLGKVELEFTRATTAQKCLRTGDTENVGRTAYHHTFFEMLGNFSFGDYFKREAIEWAWEFLTDKQWLGIDPDRLSVTVYLDDDEAFDIWHQEIGLPEDRITRLDEAENFWPASAPSKGPNGVCGPCSEIFYQPDDGPECEIWNLVFTQFNREGDPPNNLTPLPSKNIDTGMGLERTAAVLQGVSTNFHIDTLYPIVLAAAEVCGTTYDEHSDNGRRLRRITDHARAVTMAIHENVYPGSQKEESVVRQLLRRAVLQGYEMGLRDPFLFKLVPVVVEQLKEPYPDLTESIERVSQVIKTQELEFYALIERSLPLLNRLAERAVADNQRLLDADAVAQAYQTHGIPPTIAESVAEQNGLGFDWDAYEVAMKKHGETSGTDQAGVMGDVGPVDQLKRELKVTRFLGYEKTEAEAQLCGLIQETQETDQEKDSVSGELVDKTVVVQYRKQTLEASDEQQILFLDQSPFYAESGGQIGDAGFIVGPSGKFRVDDTKKDGDVFLHFGQVVEGALSEGETVSAQVDSKRREGIKRAHTATHLLHFALQKNVSADAQQRGSKVSEDDLRFDFANMEGLEESVLVAMEKQTLANIGAADQVRAEILPLADAREQGAMMLFGEKYPDPVRMVSVGDYSKELCGGIHVSNSSDIDAFEITVEENVATGTRRIQALTGPKAIACQQQTLDDVQRICSRLDTDVAHLCSKVIALQAEVKELKKQVASGRKSNSTPEVPVTAEAIADPNDYFEVRGQLRRAALALNIAPGDVATRVEQMLEETKTLGAELEKLASAGEIDLDSLIANAKVIDGVKLIATSLPSANSGLMRQLVDQLRKKAAPVAVMLITQLSEEKVLLTTGLSRDLVDQGYNAGKWINEIAPLVGGRGGGKPDMAQAGGSDPAQIEAAVEAAEASFGKLLGS